MTLIQLSTTQRTILGAACAREDDLIFPVTASIKGGPVGNSLRSMLKRGLIEEIAANDLNTVWRHDEHFGPVTLKVTPLAFSALELDGGQAVAIGNTKAVSPQPAPRRKPTKQARLIEMLQRPDGATLDAIAQSIGWQSHTVRGAISNLRKAHPGFTITSQKVEGGVRTYSITD
jgi:hypothetical protein